MVRRSRSPQARLAALIAAMIAIGITMWQQRNTPPPAPEARTPAATRSQQRVPEMPAPQPAPRAETPASVPNATAPASDSSVDERLDAVVRDAEEKRLVVETIALIEAGGPYPYRKDGSIFSNRERRLPAKPRGYYREYTVPTPGEGDRGARRVVRGTDGETYYTRDHYRTFMRIDD
jgi:ribonuclease T1